MKGASVGIGRVGTAGQLEPPGEPRQLDQRVALAGLQCAGFAANPPAPIRGLEDQAGVRRVDAPAAGLAEAWPAGQDRRLGPGSDHRGQPIGRQVQYLMNDRGQDRHRHVFKRISRALRRELGNHQFLIIVNVSDCFNPASRETIGCLRIAHERIKSPTRTDPR